MDAERGPRILIADSDSALCRQLSERLLPNEIYAECAATVTEALEQLDRRAFALVVLDVALPGGNAEAVVRRIARIPRAEQPIVLVVARDAQAARSMDVDIVQIVLRKPVDILQILDLIRSCVRSALAADTGGLKPTAPELRP